jgi:hypothetical protein
MEPCPHVEFDETQDGHLKCRACGEEAQVCPDCGEVGRCAPTCPQVTDGEFVDDNLRSNGPHQSKFRND